MFVDTSRIAVTVDGEIDHKDITPEMDVMFIRKKMDVETLAKVQGDAAQVKVPKKKQPGEEDEEREQSVTDFVNFGAYQLALMHYNILTWQGPSFVGVPCNKKTIGQLDPNEPLVQMVLTRIGERNNRAAGSDPKSSTLVGATNGVVNA